MKLQEVQDQMAALWHKGIAGEIEELLEELARSERWRPCPSSTCSR